MNAQYGGEELFDSFAVSNETAVEISRMRVPSEYGEAPNEELLAGNVLRRLCALGGAACAPECQLSQGKVAYEQKLCADGNLGNLLETVKLKPEDVLMVGVTKDNVGFYDQLSSYKSDMSVNSLGVRELPGFNAFFAKNSEHIALGARLADCGFAAIEMTADDGALVRGFVHLTRPNLQGEAALKFEIDGKPAGCFEYFLHEALKHYGADKSSVKVRLTAAIKAENFIHHFGSKTPEDLFPGWYEQGMLQNISNPNWISGDEIDPDEAWAPLYREMLMWQMLRSGIDVSQINTEEIIDPADLELGHASNHAGAHGTMPDARDLYIVMPR
jgi:hypothetical protein